MEKLECPFNWSFGDPKKVYEYSSLDDESLLPLIRLMEVLMKVFAACKKAAITIEEDQRILLDLRGCDALFSSVKKNDTEKNFSYDVIHHIVQGTRAFVYSKKQMIQEMEEAMSTIKSVDLSDAKVRSTLFGCKSICWAKYAHADSNESEKLIRRAIKDNQNCHLWHFVLGRILRDKRRNFTFGSTPKKEEEECFKAAYSLSKNPAYGIFLGQMFREKCLSKDVAKCHSEDAIDIYEQIFQQNSKNISILLRLALGFIAFKEMEKAKQCLDKIPEPPKGHHKRSMYLHYRGKYHLKSGEYWTAAKFLREAAEDDNLGADYQYMECMRRVDSKFNVSQHLSEMVEKYKGFPAQQTQRIHLMLAISYWKNDENIEESLSYFRKALAVDPKSEIFTNCNAFQIGVKLPDENIFTILETEFLPLVYKKYSCEYIMGMADTLKNYCSDYQTSLYKSAPPVRPFDLPRMNHLVEILSPKRAE
ncbi:hypothetical protein QAD02_017569 [Eretmocerus hayati]|uniref:Uncharacterized protein n=1 Tax=Eretmocerus hayati TaxID=131215 RepID=A0ACC2PH87_9HYME|nr:hypothetical protein QAD02_017569 [Eretmocerus hayati]